VSQTNDGLFLFLAETMRRPTSTVTRLRWANERPSISHARWLDPSTFERLELMELCLEHASPRYTLLGALEQALMLSPFGGGPGQCSLQSISLVALRLSTDELLAVTRSHAGTLRHLDLESMAVEPRLMGLLRNAGPPKLN
jgi:hypothetical protein